MGVSGLLQILKEIQDPVSLERYRGKTLAIDTYGWLHRALISCAEELCLGKPTRKYITFVLNKIQMLQHFGITPYFVFDGASLKTKSETNQKRRDIRNEAKQLAQKCNETGRPHLAMKHYMKAAYVTSQMCKSIMCELDRLKIRYVVAPYEADPQMVYLEKIGVVDGILSEDSDLLIFGCQKLITKLKDDASCVEINRSDFKKVKFIPYLSSFSDEQLRLVAMVYGCDYTKGISGLGLKSSFQFVRRYITLSKVVIALRSTGKKIPNDFEQEVEKANLAFQFQKVFDPRSQTVSTLNDIPESLEIDYELMESCCGKTLDPTISKKICNGFIDPNSHQILVSREQRLASLKSSSLHLSSEINQNTISESAQRSKSESAIKNSNGRSIFDLMKISRKSVNVTEETDLNSINETEGNEKSIIKTPEKPFKRPSVVLGTREIKMSPTSKKIKKLQQNINIANVQSSSSKFFGKSTLQSINTTSEPNQKTIKTTKNCTVTILPTPNKTIDEHAGWDSSLINDSEVPDESPTSQNINKENILDELTDNDLEDKSNNDSQESVMSKSAASQVEEQDEVIIDSLDPSQYHDSPIQKKSDMKILNLNRFKFSQEDDCEISEEDQNENMFKTPVANFKVNTKTIDLKQFLYKG
ncbi:EXO1 [Candida pseudojiufengensis]|uniref:EXO1 n=1 Tax=Candida pseudojiufengensis TaxID=497109 RepID=UPI002225908C|nr:EXO1 [Candida pseudojiufengensis]KAI5964181.1 EXO1 [Candida pseudojiufengensis]